MQVAIGRRIARNIPGVTFAKLMGTGTGKTFTPSDADLRQWVLLFVTEDFDTLNTSSFIKRWKKRAHDSEMMVLNPISSHGRWSKKEPFTISKSAQTAGPVVAITRARLRWRQALRFWRSISPVVEDLHTSAGLIFSIGIGEAPIGLQGTLSLWRSDGDLRQFAYKNSPHQRAISDTEKYHWYSEELFARFELINTADFPHVH